MCGPGVDDPLMGLYRPNTGSAVEYFWVTDGQGRQLAVGLVNGTMSGSSPGIYATEGGSYAGGTANAQSFAASRFETPVAPGYSFFRNRIYDQGTGRWTQEDPIGVAGGSNLYQYAGNNPVTLSDPFGLKAGAADDKADTTEVGCRPLKGAAGAVGNHCAVRVGQNDDKQAGELLNDDGSNRVVVFYGT